MTSGADIATVATMDAETAPIPAIEAAALHVAPTVRHGFFTRQGGVSRGIYGALNTGLGSRDDRALVLENRSRAAVALGARPEALVTPYQIHSATAVHVREPWLPGKGPRVDGLVTDRPGIAIGIGSADCGPVLFADAEAGVVGAAHAGWQGALTGVLEATLETMAEHGAEPERTVAVLGPTISQAAYEVGPEFVDRFRTADPANERFFAASPRAGHALFDLPGYIVARLQAAGVADAVDLGRCTYEDEDRFFSYRRATHRGEPDYGRLLSAIMLTD